MTPNAVRWASGARAVWGMLQIVAPGAVLDAGHGRNDRTSRSVLRVLGARHVVQAIAVAAVPTTTFVRLGAVADALHATSAMALAGIDQQQRRYALTETMTASAWAASGWILQLRR